MVFTKVSQEKSFWSMVEKSDYEDGCWLWKGAFCPDSGYGKFRVGKRIWNTHRLIFEHAYGALPAGHNVVRHCYCRNRLCVRLSHLKSGTWRDNWQDSVRDGTAKPFRAGHTPWNKGKRLVEIIALDELIAGLVVNV